MIRTYNPQGVCAQKIEIVIKEGIIKKVAFIAGCQGNLQGLSRLAEGMSAKLVAEKLKGINCSNKGTSCPDQLARAIEVVLTEQGT